MELNEKKISENILRRILVMLVLVFFMSSFSFAEPFFKLSSYSGALILKYQLTYDKETSYDEIVLDFQRNYMEAGLQLVTSGSVYHPNLLSFNIDFKIFGHKTGSTYFSESVINNSVNDTYNIDLLFLKKKKINFQLYSFQTFASDDRAFSERFFISSRSTGIKINNKTKTLPFVLDINQREMKSESLTYNEREEDSKNIELKMDIVNIDNFKSDFKLKNKDYSEKVFDVNYKSFELFSNSFYYYGKEKKNSVSSILTYHKMSEDIDLNIFQLKVLSRHNFTDNLDVLSTYSYFLDLSRVRSSERSLFSFSLNHKLFDSLLSSAVLGGRIEDSIFQNVNAYNFGARLNYKKKIKDGFIFFGFERNFEKGEYISKSDISSESKIYRFSLNDLIILTVPGINIESITITDADISKIYIKGVDYRVDILDTLVSIIRIPGSEISIESKVMISYDFLTYPDHDLEKNYSLVNFRINFLKYFHLFYKKRVNKMEIFSKYFIQPYENYTREQFGFSVLSKWLTGEYIIENYDSSFAGYGSRYLNFTGGFEFLKYFRLSGNLTFRKLEYATKNLFSDFNAYSAVLSFKPAVKINFITTYRKIEYISQNFFSDRESLILKFNWNIRKIIIDLFFEYLLNNYNVNERNHSYLNIIVRRLF